MPEESSDKQDRKRLDGIVDKLRPHGVGGSAVIFGEGKMCAGVIYIDYGSFSRLSDDAVAVMILEKLFMKEPLVSRKEISGRGTSDARLLLESDEIAGVHLSMCGFRLEGFSEWLDDQRMQGQLSGKISDSLRIEAFQKGYHAKRGGTETVGGKPGTGKTGDSHEWRFVKEFGTTISLFDNLSARKKIHAVCR